MPTITACSLYDRLRSEKDILKGICFDLTPFRCVCIKNNVSQFLLLVLQIDLHEILQLWVFSYKLCLISPADICISWKFKSEELCKCKVIAQSDSSIFSITCMKSLARNLAAKLMLGQTFIAVKGIGGADCVVLITFEKFSLYLYKRREEKAPYAATTTIITISSHDILSYHGGECQDCLTQK